MKIEINTIKVISFLSGKVTLEYLTKYFNSENFVDYIVKIEQLEEMDEIDEIPILNSRLVDIDSLNWTSQC